MPKKSNKRKKNRSKLKAIKNDQEVVEKSVGITKNVNKILAVGFSGFLLLALQPTVSFLRDGVNIEYVRSLDKGYEFTIENNSPVDYKVESFQVSLGSGAERQLVFKLSQEAINRNNQGGQLMPTGFDSYIPAVEYRGLDGFEISSGESNTFFVPPLSAKRDLVVESAIIYTTYKAHPKNKFFRKVNDFISLFFSKELADKKRYLVSNNYWSSISFSRNITAVEAACRDTHWFSESTVCR
ncbi:hypothetical protein BCU98_19795 [Vibrio splendidus]|uniref:hypothetical protein n=1 Tax=Vibrio splendidus TaxID=29497 RepID=UPI000C816BE7|nr:hypothetical protein [Vibrio splendidus]PMG13742.1 hypothetical protein BCU98_19795 [Vibrio splendidus]